MRSLGVLTVLGLVAACSEPDLILPGERLALRDGQEAFQPAPTGGLAIALPAAVNHGEWPQRGGSAAHRLTHPAFSAAPQLLWSAPIGTAQGRQYRITADPVVAGGRIFTLDARATVTATAENGATLWSRDLTPASERNPRSSGGALAYGEGRLYVTTAYGRLTALDPATGNEIWTQQFDAPVTAAPTISNGTVYVIAADNTAWAIDAANGRERWQLSGTPTASAFVGGPAPAVSGRTAVLPYSSGELVAVFRDSGTRLWSTTVAGSRPGRAWAGITDITGDPVIEGDTVYVGNASGRVMAVSLSTGDTLWTAREGAYGPVWPVGGSLFLVSDEGQLVRLDAANGARVWAADLPYFTETRERRRNEIVAHYGPVLAGSRLWLASGDGALRAFDPTTGALVGQVDIPGGAAASPVVVNGTMYVVGTNGQLHAFR